MRRQTEGGGIKPLQLTIQATVNAIYSVSSYFVALRVTKESLTEWQLSQISCDLDESLELSSQ